MLHSKQIMAMLEHEISNVYKTPEQRAAYRAGMSTAFAACDYIVVQMGTRNARQREKAAVAKLCGDMIEGLRKMVRVHDNERR